MNTRFASRPLRNILLVEDNEDDVIITRHALRRENVAARLHVASDGVEGMQFLRREAPFQDAPRPDIVLLDLNMPRMDGRQMLVALKGDPSLRHIPTILLTTSDAETDIANAYQAHANAYLIKPVDFQGFTSVIRALSTFWLCVTRLPENTCPVHETIS